MFSYCRYLYSHSILTLDLPKKIKNFINVLTPDVSLNVTNSVVMATKTIDEQCILFLFINTQL
jgi:hypothetical protein